MTVTRRQFLVGLGAVAAAGCSSDDDADDATGRVTTTTDASTTSTTEALALDDRFALGVASGDPDSESVALWTRLLGDLGDDDVALRWEVASDDAFADVVADGDAVAEAAFGHSVHVVADGLEPATTYRYRFRTSEGASPPGTTRTCPAADDSAPLGLAVASCQRYSDGFWAAHRDLAAADVDLVLFLGDFVYETASPGIRMLPGAGATEPAADLEGYRLRYEAARSDPDLAACAAAHPWVVTWDDHEVASNYDGPTVDAELRSAAYQAWWEHQPTRVPPPEDGALSIARTVRWGGTATLVVLDTRQHRVTGETVLGAEQRAWALEEIGAATTAWTVLGSSIVFSPVVVGEQINPDAWDGFPTERDALAGALRAGAGRPLVVSGDVHVEVVLETPGEPAIPEAVCPSISSVVGGGLSAATPALPLLVDNVRHAADRRGWLRIDLATVAGTARYREVVDAASPTSAVVDGPSFRL